MKKIWQTCKAYPIAIVFFVFLMGFSVLDALWPKRAHSELENRDLAQKPAFSIASVVSKQNPWMVQYEAYVKDQIAFRDGWIDLKSYAEAALLKTENNDVYYGEDGYLFKQLLGVDESRFARNVTALANLCERHPGMVDVMIVPSASLVLKDKLPANAPGLDENAHLDEIYAAAQAAGGNPYDMREVLGAHADAVSYTHLDVYKRQGQRVYIRPKGDAPRAGAAAAVHRIEPCPAVCDGKRRVRLQKLLQHALCARLAARKLGRGVQRMAQRHCLFIQCVIQSQASPCLAAAAGPPASILAHGGRFEKPHGQKAPRAGCAGRASPPAQKSGRAPAGPCRRYVRTGKFCFALLAYLPK